MSCELSGQASQTLIAMSCPEYACVMLGKTSMADVSSNRRAKINRKTSPIVQAPNYGPDQQPRSMGRSNAHEIGTLIVLLLISKIVLNGGLGRQSRRPFWSYFYGLRESQCVFEFDAKIPHGAIHLSVPQ